ncbi:MAG: class I SAM-dependent methyltransferase [Actinomycetota bacterium]
MSDSLPSYSSAHYQQTVDEVSRREASEAIVPLLQQIVMPTSVIDVGCGRGTWLATFVARGVADIMGVDSPHMDVETLFFPPERFLGIDLERPFSIGRTFHLALSLEVAEHLPEGSAKEFVRSLTRLAPVVAFSAAIPFQGGDHHVNEQWPSYWAKLFEAQDYSPIDCLRRDIWRLGLNAWWYAQNLILYVSQSHLETHERLEKLADEPGWVPISLVHPDCYMQWVNAGTHPSGRQGIAAILAASRRRMRNLLARDS